MKTFIIGALTVSLAGAIYLEPVRVTLGLAARALGRAARPAAGCLLEAARRIAAGPGEPRRKPRVEEP